MARGKRGGGGGGGGVSDARELRLFLAHRMWREHRFALAGAAALALALLAAAFVQFARSDARLFRVDAALEARVFSSGEPWAVLCAREDDAAVPAAVDALPARLRGRVRVGVMDCARPMAATGESAFRAFGLRRGVQPTVFTVANGQAPKQVQPADLASARALARRVLAQTKKTVDRVRSDRQLAARCLERRACALLLRGRRLEPHENGWLRALALELRAVAFVWADARELRLRLGTERELPAVGAHGHGLVLFRRERGEPLAARAMPGGAFDAETVGRFLRDGLAPGAALEPLASPPTLERRRRTGQGRPQEESGRDGGRVRDEHGEEDEGEDEDELLVLEDE